MSTKVPQNHTNQEIDIFDISKSIGGFFERLNVVLFRSIHFFVRNWILVVLLIAVGFGLGWYLDKNKNSYENQIVVSPNFGSVDYLYSKVELINSKIISGDASFLKDEVGISDPGLIKKIEIKPVADVYKFIYQNKQNLELIKLMAEVGEIKKVLEDNVTSKHYTFHTISFSSSKILDKKVVAEPLLKYLNNSEYYVSVQKIGVENLKQEIAQNDTIIAQIDRVLRSVGRNESGVSQNNKLLYVNDSSPLNDIIETKKKLITEQGENRLKLSRSDKTIQDVDLNLNINDVKILDGNFKFILPLVFLLIFVFVSSFANFYKSHLSRYNQINKQ